MKQYQLLHAVQHLVTQLSVDLNVAKHERILFHANIHQLEDKLALLRRQVKKSSSSSLRVRSTVNPSCSTALQDKRALESAPIPQPMPTFSLMGASSTLEPRIKQMEEEFTEKRDCREAILSTFRSQFTFLKDKYRSLESGCTDIILWKSTSLKFVFDNAKSSTQLDDAAKDASARFISPLYHTHPHGYNYLVQLYPYGLESAAGFHALLMFALFLGDYDDILEWPFSKTIHISVRDQLDPHNKWTVNFALSEQVCFRRPTRDPCPILKNLISFPHCKTFSKTENFLLSKTLYLELNFINLPDPKPATSRQWPTTFFLCLQPRRVVALWLPLEQMCRISQICGKSNWTGND